MSPFRTRTYAVDQFPELPKALPKHTLDSKILNRDTDGRPMRYRAMRSSTGHNPRDVTSISVSSGTTSSYASGTPRVMPGHWVSVDADPDAGGTSTNSSPMTGPTSSPLEATHNTGWVVTTGTPPRPWSIDGTRGPGKGPAGFGPATTPNPPTSDPASTTVTALDATNHETLILSPDAPTTVTVQLAGETSTAYPKDSVGNARTIGLITGGVVLALILAVALVFFCLRRRRSRAARLRELFVAEPSANTSSVRPFLMSEVSPPNYTARYSPYLTNVGSELPPAYATESGELRDPGDLEPAPVTPFPLHSNSKGVDYRLPVPVSVHLPIRKLG